MHVQRPKSKIEVPADSAAEGRLPGLPAATFSLCPHVAESRRASPGVSYTGTNLTSSKPNRPPRAYHAGNWGCSPRRRQAPAFSVQGRRRAGVGCAHERRARPRAAPRQAEPGAQVWGTSLRHSVCGAVSGAQRRGRSVRGAGLQCSVRGCRGNAASSAAGRTRDGHPELPCAGAQMAERLSQDGGRATMPLPTTLATAGRAPLPVRCVSHRPVLQFVSRVLSLGGCLQKSNWKKKMEWILNPDRGKFVIF